MSFPASLTTRTVKGRFVTYPAGTAAKGRVRIVLNDFMQGPTDNAFVAPFDETIPLDRNGEFSILLPATNDPQWTPSYYKITITIGEKIVRDKFQVSYDETDDLDLSDVLNLPAPTPGESYLLASSKGVAGGVAGLGSDGKVPANQLPPASGGSVVWGDIEEKPATFPHDEVTYEQIADKPDLFPPVAHDHPMSNVTGLVDALGTKANSEEVAQSLNHKADLVDGVLASWQLPVSDKADVGLGSVDNTSDADKPVSTAQQTALNLKAPLASPTFTGTVSGVSKAMVGLGNADNTSDANKPVSTAQQSALDLKANLASPTLTGAPSAPTATAGTNTTQLATTGFVTTAVAPKADASAVSTALAGKADLVGGVIPTSQIPALAINETYTVASQAAMLALTAQRGDVAVRTDFTPYHLFFLASDSPGTLADWKEITAAGSVVTVNGQSGVVVLGKADVGLGSVDNTTDTAKPVSTAQQTALDLKAPLASPTFSGTVSGISKSMVGLGNVDNTSDANKAVSIATTAALAAKVSKGDLVYNIRDYLAVGDGTTDDTNAINAAINAANAAGGGTVIVPPGTYIFTAIVLQSNVTLLNHGGVLKFKDNTAVNSASSYYLILASNKTNVRLIDLIIDGNKANNLSFTVCDAITVTGENIIISGCTITNPPDSGVMFSKVTNSALLNCRINGAPDVGLYINDGDGTLFYENVIAGNRITDCLNGGIALKRITSRCVVSDNTIYNCGYGITLEHASTTSDFSTNLSIIGNRIRYIGYIKAGGRGIDLRGCDHVVCIGNRIEDVTNHGILLTSARYSTVMGNVISHTATAIADKAGIYIADRSPLTYGSSRNVISGNTILNPSGPGIWVTGIVTATTRYNTIANNQIVNATTYGLLVDQYVTDLVVTGNTFEGITADVSVNSSAGAISPIGNKLVHGTVTGALGTWLTQAGSNTSINVTDYGAIGDGIVDDTTAVQAALTALGNGGTLVFPMGKNYLVGGLAINNKIDAIIDGRGAKLTLKATGTRIGLAFTGTCTNVTVQNLVIVGNGLTTDQHAGIYCASGQTLTGIRILNNKIKDVTLGISFSADTSTALQDILIQGNRLENIVGTASGYGYGIHHSSDTTTTNQQVRIVNNMVVAAQRHGIYQAKGCGIVIAGNTILDHRATVANGSLLSAIMVARSSDVTVTTNSVSRGADSAVSVAGGPVGNPCRNVTVVGNTFSMPIDTVPMVIIGQQFPSTDLYPEGVVFQGNAIYTDTAAGLISVYSGKHVRIAGNVLQSTSASSASAIRINCADETAGTTLYTDDITVESNTIFMASGGVKLPFNVIGMATTGAFCKIHFANNRITTPGNIFSTSTITNPNVSIIGQGTTGLTLSGVDLAGIALSTPDIQTFTSSGTYTKPMGAKVIEVIMIGGGGGGSSGRKGADGTIRSGGTGGAGGALVRLSLPASAITDTVAVTVGTGGAGAAAQTTDSTNGNAGTAGTDTTFGGYLKARHGNGGSGGGVANTTGGVAWPGTSPGGVGAPSVVSGTAAGTGPVTNAGAPGGCSGGSITAANLVGAGGFANSTGTSWGVLTDGAAGVIDGAVPTVGQNAPTGLPIPGAVSGGGAASVTTNAQAGAAGALYGCGGSGGGASKDGVGNSGAGGAGAAGIAQIISYF